MAAEEMPYQFTGNVLASITKLPSNTWKTCLVVPGTHWKLKKTKTVKTRIVLKQWLTLISQLKKKVLCEISKTLCRQHFHAAGLYITYIVGNILIIFLVKLWKIHVGYH